MKYPLALVMIVFVLISVLHTGCFYDNKTDLYPFAEGPCDSVAMSYQQHILPILQAHCISCHHAGDAQGNVDLDTHAKVISYVNDGSLYGSTAHLSGYSPMPTAGQKIPGCNILQLKAWIDTGAKNN